MPIDIIVKFVERKTSTEEFLKQFHENEQLKEFLSEKLTFESYIGDDLYLYLSNRNLLTLFGLVDSLGALKLFLKDKQIQFVENNEDINLYSLLLDVQPRWIELPSFYLQKLLDMAGERQGAELKRFLKEEIKQKFKCMKSTPKWIQGASWIFVNEEPLLFVGQLDITEMRHDTSKLYIFLDEKTGNYHTVEQSM